MTLAIAYKGLTAAFRQPFMRAALRNSSTASKILFSSLEDLKNASTSIKRRLEERGFVILTPLASKFSTEQICELFGNVQTHARAPEDGIVEIQSGYQLSKNSQVASAMEFFPHTDGAYLRGIINTRGVFKKVMPPKLILLECVKAAKEGGVTFVVDAQRILQEVIWERKEWLPLLFSNSHFHMCRGSHLIMNFSIFSKLSSGRFGIRYSYDQDMFLDASMKGFLEDFNDFYISNPKYRTYCPLHSGEYLVIDNHRMLHGRTSITLDPKEKYTRLLKRIWINDEKESRTLIPALGNDDVYFAPDQSGSIMEKFNNYRPKLSTAASCIKVKTGIELREEEGKILSERLKCNISMW